MANKTMHHTVIGADTFELIDEAGREETSQLKNALSTVEEVLGSVAVIDSDDKYLVTFSVNSNNHMVATFTLAS